MNPNEELIYKEYLLRENESFHAAYEPEFAFYYAVKLGEMATVRKMNSTPFSQKEGFGMLSEHPLQSLKYHFVVTTAFIARYCIEGGMPHELAYSLSDLYIQRCDKCKDFEQLSKLHDTMSLDYTERMRSIRKGKVFSLPIAKCIDYIYDHLHQRILLADLANYVKLNPCYLSRQFKKDTGYSVTDYIRIQKIETAKNMLKYSEYLPSEISMILAFPSQSYFIEVFQKLTGMTPKKYREFSYREIELHVK